jgi:hypothetical protein
MNPTTSGVIVFACTLAGVLLGMSVRDRLPSHHLNDDSHRSMKDINGLIGTMTALILSLMTASAQDSFAKVEAAVQHTATDVVTLDRLLARYGPETTEVRGDLRNAVDQRVAQIWPAEPGARIAQIDANPPQAIEEMGAMITSFEAKTANQQYLKSRALDLTESLLAARWGMSIGEGPTIPRAFVAITTFWLATTFAGYALFAPRNPTVTGILFVGAFATACVVFLILELSDPFKGWITVSADPMKFALAHLGQ